MHNPSVQLIASACWNYMFQCLHFSWRKKGFPGPVLAWESYTVEPGSWDVHLRPQRWKISLFVFITDCLIKDRLVKNIQSLTRGRAGFDPFRKDQTKDQDIYISEGSFNWNILEWKAALLQAPFLHALCLLWLSEMKSVGIHFQGKILNERR